MKQVSKGLFIRDYWLSGLGDLPITRDLDRELDVKLCSKVYVDLDLIQREFRLGLSLWERIERRAR